jgi:hypothetical protein
MRRHTLALLSLVAAAALGCGGGSRGEPATDTPYARQPAPTRSDATTGFGVKECDEYVKKYAACVDARAPEAIRAHLHQSLEHARAAWHAAAATSEGRIGLANACSQALASAKAAMQMYGCEW